MGRNQNINSSITENDMIEALGRQSVERLREIYAICSAVLLEREGGTKKEIKDHCVWMAKDLRETCAWACPITRAASQPALITHIALRDARQLQSSVAHMGCPEDGDTAFDMYAIKDERAADAWLIGLLPELAQLIA